MAKRIIVVKDNNKIEIWDTELERFEKNGWSKEGSSPIIKQQTKSKLTINKDKKRLKRIIIYNDLFKKHNLSTDLSTLS